MTKSFLFEVVNIKGNHTVATFLMQDDAHDFMVMRNQKFNMELYRVRPVSILDRPFPTTLVR